MISNLVNLSDLQKRNANIAKLAPQKGVLTLPGATKTQTSTPSTSSKLTIGPNSNVSTLAGIQPQKNASGLSLNGMQINQQSGQLGRAPTKDAPPVKGLVRPQAQPLVSNQTQTPPTYYQGKVTDYGRSIGLTDEPTKDTKKKKADTKEQAQTQPQFSPLNPATFTGLIAGAANTAGLMNTQAGRINKTAELIGSQTQMSPEELKANVEAAKLEQERAKALGNIGTHGWSAAFQQGQEGLVNRNVAAQSAAAQAVAQKYSEQRKVATEAYKGQAAAEQGAGGVMQGAGGLYSNAAGIAQPVQVPYSNQYVDPQTGQPVGGGTLGGSLQQAVQGVVAKLQSGEMSFEDAKAMLSGYGQGGVNALMAALPPGFNVAQSNMLAGQQGTVGVSYQFANTALSNVEQAMQQLNGLQQSNVPIWNQFANMVSLQTGLGSEQTRAFVGAVQTLRNAYAALLASAKGGTPTDFSAQAVAEIPDIPTPNDLAAIRHNLETLGAARANIYGNPGLSNNQNASANLFSW